MSLLDALRDANPALKDVSDEDILIAAQKHLGGSPQQAASMLGYSAPTSDMGKELYAGGNRYLAGFGHIGSAVGIPGAAEYTAAKEKRADVLQALSDAPHSWEETKIGDSKKGLMPYLGQLAAGSAPYAAEAAGYAAADALTGGALTPAILARYGAVAPRMIGGGALEAGADIAARRAALEQGQRFARGAMLPAVTYPSALGDTLGNQFEEAGQYNLPRAAGAAVPYAALNAVGLEGAIARGSLPRLGLKSMETSMLGRAASGAFATGVSEGANEFGQEVANQWSRMGVNPNATFTDPEALNRYKEAAIGGAFLGGLPGSLHAFNRPSPFQDKSTESDLITGKPLGLTYNPNAGQYIVYPDGSTRLATDPMTVHPNGDVTMNETQEFQRRTGTVPGQTVVPDVAGGQITKSAAPQIFDNTDKALIDAGVKPTPKTRALHTELTAAGFSLGDESMQPVATLMAESKYNKAKVALAEAIIARNKEQQNVGTTGEPATGLAPSVAVGGNEQPGSVGATGLVPSVAADGANSGNTAGVVPAVQEAGVQPDTAAQQTAALTEAWDAAKPDDGVDFASLPANMQQMWSEAVQAKNAGKPINLYKAAEVISNESAPQSAAPQLEAREAINKIFGERNADILYDAFVNKLTSEEIGNKYGTGSKNVRKMTGEGAVGQKWRAEKIAAAQKANGWSDDYVQQLMSQFEAAASDVETTDNTATDEFDNATTAQLNDAGFGKVDSEGSSEGNTKDSLTDEKLATATGRKLAAALTQRIFEQQERVDEITTLLDQAVNSKRKKISIGDKNVTLEEAQQQIEQMRGEIKTMMDNAAAALKNAKPDEEENLTEEERAGQAWDEVAADYPDAPRWADLSQEQRDDFVGYGEDNWTPDDVLHELGRLDYENVDRLTSEPSVYGETNRVPSLSRGITTLRGQLDGGKITPEGFTARVEILHNQVQQAKRAKPVVPRMRGADFIRQRLLEAKRKGWLSDEAVSMAEWFISKNPNLVDDLGLSFLEKKDGVSGNYSPVRRIMTLMKGSSNNETTVHEILHHLERMMPEPAQRAIRAAWLKSLTTAAKGAADANTKEFYKLLLDYHLSDSKGALKQATKLIKDGKVSYDHYQHVNPSEFWAVNAARIMEGRFGVKDSVIGQIRQWMREFIQKIKGVLGLKSDAAVLKALDAVMKGDGKFLPGQTMIQEGASYNMFGGTKAELGEGQKAGLATAMLNDANGVNPRDTWKETGWYKAKDGQWRFEIDDSVARFKGPLANKPFHEIARMEEMTLDEVLDHDELFDQYPELRDVKFEVRPIALDVFRATQGWFDEKQNKLYVTPYAQNPLSTTLHEIQHWIQSKEGFENGANPRTVDLSNKAALNKLRDQLVGVQEKATAADAEAKEARKRGEYPSTFDLTVASITAKDMMEGVDGLLAHADELAPKYAQMRALDDEIERLQKARDVLDKKYREQNKKVNVAKKLIDYAGQMKELRFYSDKAKAAAKERDEINSEVKALVKNYTGGRDVAHELYRLVAGEAEARNTQARQGMEFGERFESFPEDTMDVGADNTLTSTGRGGAYMNIERNNAFAGASTKMGDWLTNPKHAFAKIKLGFLTLEQMAEMKLPRTDLIRNYSAVMTAMQKTSKDLVYRAAKIDLKWAKLDQAMSARLSEVMREATRAQFDPDLHEEGTLSDNAQAILDKFNKLSPDAQQVYREVRQHYEDMFKERKAILANLATRLGGKALKEVDRMYAQMKGPYFPLGRTGNFYSVGMSDRVAALMDKQEQGKLTPDEEKELTKLRRDKTQYQARAHNSAAEAEKSSEEMRKTMGNSFYNEKAERISEGVAALPDFAKLEDSITANMDADMRKQVKELLTQFMFDSLPEHHALKNTMRREGIYGENEDMRQVFAQTSLSQAHYLSRLQHGESLTEAMQEVRRSARRDIQMRAVENELVKRAKLAMERSDSAFVDALVNASYFAHLGLSPAFIMTNMTQVPMITAPWLGARHGLGATKSAVSAALVDAASIIKSSYSKGGWRAELNWNDRFKKGSNEDRLFTELLDRNILDITVEHDLAAVAKMQRGMMDDQIAKASGNKLQGLNDLVQLVNTPVRITELGNRAVTALSAYRLKMAELTRTGMAAEAAHNAAVDYAAKAVSQTQMNYSELNAPRYMRTVLGSQQLARMMFQFRKFQQGMFWLIAKNISDALPNSKATKEERRFARRTIAGLYATTGLMAGTSGMPLMGTVGVAGLANLVAAAFGDDDEPWDFNIEFRNYLTDWVGADAALLITKGIPAYLGADVSQRVGMADITNPVPFLRSGKTGQETVGNTMVAIAGAPFGTVATTVDGIMDMAGGNVQKGFEKVMPVKAVKDVMKAYRYADEGMTDKRGNLILGPEKFDSFDIAFRAMGFTPTIESDYYAANTAVQEAKSAAEDVRNSLVRQYTQARLTDGDVAGIQDKIDAFNERHDEKGVRITMATLLKAMQERRKMGEQRSESGVRNDKKIRPYADRGRFANRD